MTAYQTHAQPVDGSDIPDKEIEDIWFNSHEPGLAHWLRNRVELQNEVRYAMSDAPLEYGDPDKPWIELAKHFDDNDRFPSESFKTEATNYLWAVIKRLDEFRKEEE